MGSGMPELGSMISLISKADIRYEGRLFTVDPQECTIALASVRSFGTEDREAQFAVAPQSQVYDYILFRGSDIKDIRIVPSLPNDPAIMQMSVPPSLGGGGGGAPGQFPGQFSHPVVGQQQQQQYPQYHPMAGFPASVHSQLSKTSELSSSVDLSGPPQPMAGPIGSGIAHHSNQVKDQGSMLDLIGGKSQQSQSRSGTPSVGHRKSPTADQGTQVGHGGQPANRDSRRGSNPQQKQANQQRNRTNSRNRQRYPSGGANTSGGQSAGAMTGAQASGPPHQNQQNQHHNQHNNQHNQHNQHPGGMFGSPSGYGRGGWRGRSRGRGRGFIPRGANKNTLKFDNDYDFEQANTEFEELRSQLAKTKITDEVKPEITVVPGVEVEKKEDSGNETGAGEPELDEDGCPHYDKAKSFFDNISCEAVERSKGRSQRTDWRTERKLNSETFGVALARRGAWRGRPLWRHNQHNQHGQHNQHNQHHNQMNSYSWRARGGRPRAPPAPRAAAAAAAQGPPPVTAK